MRLSMIAAGLGVILLAGFVTAETTPATPSTPSTPAATTMHVDLTAKNGATKIAVGDKCTIVVKKAKTGDTYDVTVTDSSGTPSAKTGKATTKAATKVTKVTGTLEESTVAATLDLKKLAKVSWTVIDGNKGKDVLTLQTSETLPTK